MLRLVCGIIVYRAACLSIMADGDYVLEFGKRLRQLREKRGMSQEQLADLAELHRTHISLIERGVRAVRVDTIERLAHGLSVQPAKLMPPIKLGP